ncbi:multidrug effflux MFS transporter [Marinomonas algicola]|uniref:multidrug effflux MFS transporter n=1 Tax=Marinomonas algicola TaxID=2773454 RepID=UPI00174A0AC1|nr:multidrug effflux MFS transporter [Marinomonas algicola]
MTVYSASDSSSPNKSPLSAMEFTFLTATLMSIVAISIDALLPALGVISQDLAVEDANRTQLIISMLFLGMSLGQLICGPLSDSTGRKPILYAGILIYLMGTVMCFMATDLNDLLIGRFIQGLGVAGPYISAISLVRDQYKGNDMAKIMSLVMMIFILVPAIAPSIGQAILLFTNWHGIFVLYLIYACLILIWIYIRLDETLPKAKRIPFTKDGFSFGFKEVVTNKSVISLTLSMGLIFGCLIGYINSSQQIFQEQFHTGKLFSVYFGVLALLLGIASLMNSKLVQRLGMHLITTRAFSALIVSSLVFLIIQLYVEVHLWMFMLYAGSLFFSFGLLFGNLNAMAMEPMGHVAGIASAIIGATSSILSLTVGTIIGQLYNGTTLPITIGFFIMSSLALGLLFYAEKHKAPRPDTTIP